MGNVSYINLEYFLLLGYNALLPVLNFFNGSSATPANGGPVIDPTTGNVIDPSTGGSVLADQIQFWLGQGAMLGLAIALVLFVMLIIFRIKTIVVEHEGFHGKEEHEHGAHAGHDTHAPVHTEPVVDSTNARWERVMQLATSASESDWRRAIVEADIMLGDLLTSLGYPGGTIGDQLKNANPLQFTTLDLAWKAHKVRNDIAHGGEAYHLAERDVRATIDYYARVFEEFKLL